MPWVTCRVRLPPSARLSTRPSLDNVGGCCVEPKLLADPLITLLKFSGQAEAETGWRGGVRGGVTLRRSAPLEGGA